MSVERQAFSAQLFALGEGRPRRAPSPSAPSALRTVPRGSPEDEVKLSVYFWVNSSPRLKLATHAKFLQRNIPRNRPTVRPSGGRSKAERSAPSRAPYQAKEPCAWRVRRAPWRAALDGGKAWASLGEGCR